MLVTFSRALNWRSQQMAWKYPPGCLQLVGGSLGWFFQKSHVDECAFSKSLCSWSTIKWLIDSNEIFCSFPLWSKTGHLYKVRDNYRLSSNNVDMKFGTSVKIWNLIHLTIILWIKNWMVERAFRFFSWTYHLFIARVILGFTMNQSVL